MRSPRYLALLVTALAYCATLAAQASAAQPRLLWSKPIPGYADKPNLADLDGDGRLEVILGTDKGSVVALSGTNGEQIWRTDFDDESFVSSPVVADVDHDGTAEVLVTGIRNGVVACLSGANGKERWRKRGREAIPGSAVLVDRLAPNAPLLIYAQGTRLVALNATNGDELWHATLPQDSVGTPGIARPDGGERIVIGTRRGRLLAFDMSGQPLWETSLSGGLNASPLIVDANNDGVDEVYAIGTSLFCLDLEGKENWRWSVPKGAGIGSSLACADINMDQKQELVLTAYDGLVYAVSPAGRTVWSGVVANPQTGNIPASTPVLIDTQGQEKSLDVVLASPVPATAGLLAYDGRTGRQLWRAPMAKFSQCCPAAADINGDGNVDIVATDAADTAYAFALSSPARRGWFRFGDSLYGSSTETERRRQAELVLPGGMPFAVVPRPIGVDVPTEEGGTVRPPVVATGSKTAEPVQSPETKPTPSVPATVAPIPPVVVGPPSPQPPTTSDPLPPVTTEPIPPITTVPVPPVSTAPVPPITTPPVPPVTTEPTAPVIVMPPSPPQVSGRPASEVAVQLDGHWLPLDPPARSVKGRVLAPLRGLFEALHANITYDAPTKTIAARRDGRLIVLTVGKSSALVDGQPVDLDVPAQIIDGSTYVPLRFVGQALGLRTEWLPKTRDVILTTPPSGPGG